MNPSTGTKSVLIFSYGSNLNEARLKGRCSSAIFQSVGYLDHTALCFPRGEEFWNGGGVAGYRPADGEKLWGAIHSISEDDLLVLDHEEGFYPDRASDQNEYNRVPVFVYSLQLKSQQKLWTYSANVQNGKFVPDPRYFEFIVSGLASLVPHGLPTEYIEAIQRLGKG